MQALCFNFALSARKLGTEFKAQLQCHLISREGEGAFIECLFVQGASTKHF